MIRHYTELHVNPAAAGISPMLDSQDTVSSRGE